MTIHEESLKGNELTCNDIWYEFDHNRINQYTFNRLILERLSFLEDTVERIREANELFGGR